MDENRDPLIERISDRLRAVRRADESFVERVMSAVRVSAEEIVTLRRRGWWTRPRMLRFTPIGVLALAAGFALAMAGGIQAGARARTREQGTDTVHMMRFVLVDSGASAVSVVGGFNQWTKASTPLVEQSPGVWTVMVALPRGRHEYAFIVNGPGGERWVADPTAPRRSDEFGTESSVVAIGSSS